MRKRTFIFTVVCLFMAVLLAQSGAMAQDNEQAIEEKSELDRAKLEAEKAKQAQMTMAIERAEDAQDQAEAATKEAELIKQQVEIEKQSVESEIQEAAAAKKMVSELKKEKVARGVLREFDTKAKQEEKDVSLALSKLELMQARLKEAERLASEAKKRAAIAGERADLAEGILSKERRERNKNIIHTAAAIAIAYFIMFLLVAGINRNIKNLATKHALRKGVVYVTNFVVLISVFLIWEYDIRTVTILVGAIGAGATIALQEPILSVAGWILLMTKRSFEIGDRIELGGIKGDVIDIEVFNTTVLEIGNWVEADQSTGRLVTVPNSSVFKQPYFNYSRGFEFIWNEIKVTITFESNCGKAESIMLKHAEKNAKEMEELVKKKINKMTLRYMIHFDKLTPSVYTDIKDSGVELSLRYLTHAEKRRTSHDEISRLILGDFEKTPDVNFAYTTYRIVK